MPKHAQFASDLPGFDDDAASSTGTHFSPSGTGAAQAPIAEAPLSAEKERRHSKLWLLVPVALVAALGGGYAYGVNRYSHEFLPHTTVNGIDVSGKTPDELATIAEAGIADWTATLEGDGVEVELTAQNVGLRLDGGAIAQAAMAQQDPLAWPVEYFGTHAYTAEGSVTFDEGKLWSLVEPTVRQAQEAAAQLPDGGIVYDAENDVYRVEDDQTAAHINRQRMVAQASPQIVSLAQSVSIDGECLDADERVANALAEANAIVGAEVTLHLGEDATYVVDSDRISQWISFDEDLNVVLDEQAVIDFGPGELSDLLDSVGTERSYTRPDGKEITVSGGSYGWSIEGAETGSMILAGLRSGEPSSIDVPTYQDAYQVNPGGRDWGRYIDVDRTEQHARFYDENDNLIWETDIVTGQPNLGHATPAGVWYVTSRDTNVNLQGPKNDEGVPEWNSYVDFWMGVVGQAVGLHNAPWRSSFGGDIYTWNGSHGCINMSYAAGQELFNLVEIGDTVIVHD